MSALRSGEQSVEGYDLNDWAFPTDFQMPTTEEIERDLAVGKPGWRGLLRSSKSEPTHCIAHAACVQSAMRWEEE
jgi:hypothetical protein